MAGRKRANWGEAYNDGLRVVFRDLRQGAAATTLCKQLNTMPLRHALACTIRRKSIKTACLHITTQPGGASRPGCFEPVQREQPNCQGSKSRRAGGEPNTVYSYTKRMSIYPLGHGNQPGLPRSRGRCRFAVALSFVAAAATDETRMGTDAASLPSVFDRCFIRGSPLNAAPSSTTPSCCPSGGGRRGTRARWQADECDEVQTG
jgi:hypothetical protein